MNIRCTCVLLTALISATGCATRPDSPNPAVSESAVTEEAAINMEVRMFDYTPMWPGQPFEESSFKQTFSNIFRYDFDWPPGSVVKHVPRLGKIIVKNTPEALNLIEKTLGEASDAPCQIEAQIEFVEYSMADIDVLAREDKLSAKSLLALWRQGKAKLLSSPRIVTQSGQEAIVKGVAEYIYPTAFNIAYSKTTNATGSVVASGIVEPRAFETREVGVYFSVVPDVSSDGQTINLAMTPEIVRPPTWKNYGTVRHAPDGGKDELRMDMPFFHTHTLTTQIMVTDGAKILVGGGMNNKTGDKTVYAFATARLLNADGEASQASKVALRQAATRMTLASQNNPRAHGKDPLEFRHYVLHYDYRWTLREIHGGDISLKDYLEIYGQVQWPTGADIIHDPVSGQLYVFNTPDNLLRVTLALSNVLAISYQVEIQADFVEYRMEDVDTLARENKLDPDNLLALWRQGRAQLRYAPRIVMQDSQEATIKGVTEYIYPVAFDTGFTNAAGTAVVSGEVVPHPFETREVGVILAVVSDVSADRRMIRMNLAPESVRPPTWKNYGTVRHAPDGGKDELLMEQPFFHTHTLTTQAMISNGGRVMIGGGMNNEAGDKTVYVFVTARLIDTEGHPVSMNE